MLSKYKVGDFLADHPSFYIGDYNNLSCLIGEIEIKEASGYVWEVFKVAIEAVDDLSKKFPRVYELSDKFLKIADWHVYLDGSCCFTVPQIESITCKEGITLKSFMNDWVFPYFANQAYRLREGVYINGEYGHGIIGEYEYYSELLGIKDIKEIFNVLRRHLLGNKLLKTDKCYCGSNKRYDKCHRQAVIKLRRIDKGILIASALQFQKILSKVESY